MTNLRDFERLNRAWLDLMPDEAPDRVIDAVLQAVEVTPQQRGRPRWTIWRLPKMNRFSLAAAVVVLVAIIAGGSVALSNFSRPGVGGPAAPTVSPETTATPLVPGLGRGLGYPTSAPAVFVGAAWISDIDAVKGLFHDARARLDVGSDGHQFAVTYSSNAPAMLSQPVTSAPETLALVSTTAGAGCNVGDYGIYQLAASSNGMTVTLVRVSEACGSRSSLLARTWARSLGGQSSGGRGVLAGFTPMLQLELPAGTYSGQLGSDAATIDSATRSFIALKNPVGATTPCASTPGAPRTIGTNTDAFVAYLRTLPGFDVRTAPFSIDGHPGVRVTIPVASNADCPTGRVFEWTDHTPGNLGWFIRPGDTDVLYLVNVGADIFLFQVLDDAGPISPAEEQAILSTIKFIDTLPQAG